MIAVFVQKPSFHLYVLKLIPGNTKGRGSSVVERIIGNDEVGSSILPRGTSYPFSPLDAIIEHPATLPRLKTYPHPSKPPWIPRRTNCVLPVRPRH